MRKTLTIRKDWYYLGGAVVYFLAFSLAVQRIVASEAFSPRLVQALLAGWGVMLLALVGVGVLALGKAGVLQKGAESGLAFLQRQAGWLKTLVFLALILTPALLVFTNLARGLMQDPWMRLVAFAPLLLAAAYFLPFNSPANYWGRLGVTVVLGAYAFLTIHYLVFVNSYPFSLSWSEGNRFYDYSLMFGQALYRHDGRLEIPYFSPGRYGLWGIWFLIPGLPVGFHRFWNAVLWFLPPLLLGWFVARGAGTRGLRAGLAVWTALFLSQGPIYAPILLSAVLVVAFNTFPVWKRGLSLGLASLYAGLSRWTWFAAPGAWGVMMALASPRLDRNTPWLRRFGMGVLLAALGSIPGILVNWTRLTAPKTSTLSLSQPLLWYRLLPNATYSPGILLGLAMAAGPLVLLLIWLIATRRWSLDWMQLAAFGGASLGFLAAGLIASTKIGGGSNLHNLDMFLVTLVVLVMLFLDGRGFNLTAWPAWTKGLVVLAILFPAWSVLSAGSPLVLPGIEDTQEALLKINTRVAQAKEEGEVLFMDQRQLLTFGYVTDVPLTPDYEKKYMMDQAMAGNAAYFEGFYQDLADQRFSLIVTEQLFSKLQDSSSGFSEENNAWVKWVSRPVLCYYEPFVNLRKVKVQLLQPRANAGNCQLPTTDR